jgi:hypothetical protein
MEKWLVLTHTLCLSGEASHHAMRILKQLQWEFNMENQQPAPLPNYAMNSFEVNSPAWEKPIDDFRPKRHPPENVGDTGSQNHSRTTPKYPPFGYVEIHDYYCLQPLSFGLVCCIAIGNVTLQIQVCVLSVL